MRGGLEYKVRNLKTKKKKESITRGKICGLLFYPKISRVKENPTALDLLALPPFPPEPLKKQDNPPP